MRIALYRKYRPRNFKEVLGQDQVVNLLSKAVKGGRISHAYLFSGPRGTGKTSVARILASDVGCHDYDLLEVDAASSRGIDDIRELRDGVHTVPLRGEYKVYIIDEVHMLTREAFNALLKTLEEPPGHVIFVLATTEPHKLPETVVSRCQHFSFRKLPETVIRSSVKKIAKSEGFNIDEEAAGLIALFADGSLRDAQTMLDQVLSLEDSEITGDEVRKFLSAPPQKLIEDFVSCILDKDAQRGLEITQELTEKGTDIQLFLKFVLRSIRSLLLLKLSPNKKKQLKEILGEDEVNFLASKKDSVSVADLGYILLSLLHAYDSTGRAYLPQLPLELALAKIHLRGEKK
jgi:DNA polymerase-3 subunit gamma/tau